MIAFVLALRLGRWGIVGFSTIAFLSSLIQAVAFYQLAGHTPAQRATFAQSIAQVASRFTVILPPPTRLDTVGGYIQWRSYGGLAIVFAVWALISASGAGKVCETFWNLRLVRILIRSRPRRKLWPSLVQIRSRVSTSRSRQT